MKIFLFLPIFSLLFACSQSPSATPEVQITYVTTTPQVVPVTATPQPGSIDPELLFEAPHGEPPLLDGKLSDGEWTDARLIELDSGELLLMSDGDYLYLGIHSEVLGIGSPCVYRNDQIDVLHASAALGTATYVKSDSGIWGQTRNFEWTNRATDQSQVALDARQKHLEEENWLASTGLTGDPHDMEYQIAMADGVVQLAVTYLEGPGYNTAAFWPSHLADACLNTALMRGEPPNNLNFSPETWMTVVAAPADS